MWVEDQAMRKEGHKEWSERKCAVCGAQCQWGQLCRKHYSYYDFTGKRLKKEVDKKHKWKKEIKS
jgi:hypothetical protein